MVKPLTRILDRVNPLVWAAGILLLPITSMPLVSRLVHSDMVAAPAALPFAWLFVFYFIPCIFKRLTLPKVTLPILAFAMIAVLASAAAFFMVVPPLKGRSILSREIQALVTLAVGLVFYIVTTTWLRRSERLRWTLQLLNFAGLATILWSAAQAVAFIKNNGYYPDIMIRIQEIISVSGNLYYKRATGFAFEPSWLAHQLNMLWLPYWAAATIQRFSAHRFRFLSITFENLLLVGGAATLFYSFSRVGLLAFMLVIAYLLLLLNLWIARRMHAWLKSRFSVRPAWKAILSRGISLVLLVAFLAVYIAGAYGLVVVASKYDPRLAKVFEQPRETIFSFQYANQLAFAERVVFWATGWSIFNEHPWIGVGLGNAGYFFQDNLPAFAWALPEVRTLMYRDSYLPNTKSLWTRILAETGLLGFSFFIVWLFLVWQSGHALRSSRQPIDRAIGLAGVLTIVALLVEGFSIDSFALPYLWIALGFVTAAIQPYLHVRGDMTNQVIISNLVATKVEGL